MSGPWCQREAEPSGYNLFLLVGWGWEVELAAFRGSLPRLWGEDRVEGRLKTKERWRTVSTPRPPKGGMKWQKEIAFLHLSQQSGCPGSRPVSLLWPQQEAL